jgi:hypothetical protein
MAPHRRFHPLVDECRLGKSLKETAMNKRSVRSISFVFGGVMLASLLAYPLANRTAQADERHNPKLHHAIEALQDAKAELDAAHHDFHGRKRDAEEAIDHAIGVLNEIKDYD